MLPMTSGVRSPVRWKMTLDQTIYCFWSWARVLGMRRTKDKAVAASATMEEGILGFASIGVLQMAFCLLGRSSCALRNKQKKPVAAKRIHQNSAHLPGRSWSWNFTAAHDIGWASSYRQADSRVRARAKTNKARPMSQVSRRYMHVAEPCGLGILNAALA